MLNNKGFAVSSVLYTLLIAFLLFLGAALAQFSASSSLIGKANDDLVNGTQFEAVQVKPDGACINTDTEGKDDWYLQYKDDNKNKNVDDAVKESAKFSFMTLRYDAVKYFGVFNIMYKYYLSKQRNDDFTEIVCLDKFMSFMEHNVVTN